MNWLEENDVSTIRIRTSQLKLGVEGLMKHKSLYQTCQVTTIPHSIEERMMLSWNRVTGYARNKHHSNDPNQI